MTHHVERLLGISLTCARLDRTARFYTDVLGFETVARSVVPAPARLGLADSDEARVERLVLRLGSQEIECLAFDPPGRPYPADSSSTDLWFQHAAIVVSDMEAAFSRLRAAGVEPVSKRGPERLPAKDGGVLAFKFRDPDGHPLELLWFPPGVGDPSWHQAPAGRLFVGIDHSAIAVADAAASASYYERELGLRRTSETLNQGEAQERLDDVAHDRVDVVALAPIRPTPHLELLGYRTGRRRPMPSDLRDRDIAATRTIYAEDRTSSLASGEAGPQLPTTMRDPDGHRIVIL
jgi:catechol 2,3-dioxygenase-like lactoylglutathione lyase family enzyme